MATTAPQPRGIGGLRFMQTLSSRVYLARPSPDDTTPASTRRPRADHHLWLDERWRWPTRQVRPPVPGALPDLGHPLVTCTFAGMTLRG